MKAHVALFAAILIAQTISFAQESNNVTPTNILDIIRKGAISDPIVLTPEQDAQLVKEGILPPLEPGTNSHVIAVGTNESPSGVQIGLRFVNCPADMVLAEYARLTAKQVLFEGGGPNITVVTKTGISPKEAILLIETELTAAGFTLSEVDKTKIKVEWRPKTRKEE